MPHNEPLIRPRKDGTLAPGGRYSYPPAYTIADRLLAFIPFPWRSAARKRLYDGASKGPMHTSEARRRELQTRVLQDLDGLAREAYLESMLRELRQKREHRKGRSR